MFPCHHLTSCLQSWGGKIWPFLIAEFTEILCSSRNKHADGNSQPPLSCYSLPTPRGFRHSPWLYPNSPTLGSQPLRLLKTLLISVFSPSSKVVLACNFTSFSPHSPAGASAEEGKKEVIRGGTCTAAELFHPHAAHCNVNDFKENHLQS